MNDRTDEQKNDRMHMRMDKRLDGSLQSECQITLWTEGGTDRWMYERIERMSDRWIEGPWMDEQTNE